MPTIEAIAAFADEIRSALKAHAAEVVARADGLSVVVDLADAELRHRHPGMRDRVEQFVFDLTCDEATRTFTLSVTERSEDDGSARRPASTPRPRDDDTGTVLVRTSTWHDADGTTTRRTFSFSSDEVRALITAAAARIGWSPAVLPPRAPRLSRWRRARSAFACRASRRTTRD